MKCMSLSLAILTMCAHFAFAAEEPKYYVSIKEFSRRDTPEDNAALVEYLKSLTKDQMLIALRECGKEVEADVPLDKWPYAGFWVMRILLLYPEPLRRSDLSAEQFRNMRPGARRDLEAGLLPRPLSDEAFDKLLTIIADRKEGVFIRYALAGHYLLNDDAVPDPSKPQKERLLKTCLAVADEAESPLLVRIECCRIARELCHAKCTDIIYADDAVQELRQNGPPERYRKVESLIESGGVKLSARTIEQLAPWRQRILNLRKVLARFQEDDDTPEALKRMAKGYMNAIDRSQLTRLLDAISRDATIMLPGSESKPPG